MSIDFIPQFHQRISQGRGPGVWVAIPQPKMLIPVKPVYYLAWQQEECLRLQEAGEEVLSFAGDR
jgi:hypothetical protein